MTDITLLFQPLRKNLGLLLMLVLLSQGYRSNSQTTISTQPTFSVNNGYGLVTFNFQNTNPFPVTITGVNACVTSTNASTFKLWYKTTPVAGPPGVISTANGWVLSAQQSVTSTIGFYPNNVTEPVITGASLTVPANTTYGIAVSGFQTNGTGNMNYMTIPAANLPTATFSAGGCNIITGTNISYATTVETNAPTFTPRGFVGSVTFMQSGAFTCSTATFPTIVDISSNVDSICNNGTANFTLNTTMPTATGIFYQWQWATAPTGPWTNLGAAQSTANYNATGITATRWYRMQVLCGTTVQRTSDSVLVVVRPTPVPSASISANPGNNICSGTPVTFTATINNGGSGPGYQWKLNGNNVGTNSPTYSNSTLAQGDQIQLALTSTALCASPSVVNSNTITMTVTNTVTPDVTITSNPIQNTICSGTPVTFTATPVNGGTTPSYQWRVNGVNVGTNSNTFTTTALSNADIINVILTTSLPCYTKQKDTSNTLTFFITPSVTPDATITSNTPNNTACKNSVVRFSATVNHPGLNPSYQWKVNGNPVGASNLDLFISTLNNGDVVSFELTSDALCRTKNRDTSNAIVMTITNGPIPVITKQGNVLTTGSYAGYQWIKDGAAIAGATAQSYVVSAPGNYWVLVKDNNSCEAESNVLWVPYVLGISNTTTHGVRLYPNPTNGKIVIESVQPVNLTIFSSVGQMVGRAYKIKDYDLSKLPDGVYLLEIRNDKGALLLREKVTKSL